MADNEIIKALGQVPDLVETVKTVLAEIEKKFGILSEVVQKRVQATIPENELEKVSDRVSTTVSRTRCATPDVSDVSRCVADEIIKNISTVTTNVVTEATKSAIDGMQLKVEHHHTHTTLGYMCQMAEKTLRNWILGLAIYSCIITIIGGIIACSFFNGGKYLSEQYAKIYFSDYTTEAERKMLNANIYTVTFLPKEFDRNPALVKQKIKRNKQILLQRETEAKANKGKFSTKIPLER